MFVFSKKHEIRKLLTLVDSGFFSDFVFSSKSRAIFKYLNHYKRCKKQSDNLLHNTFELCKV